MPSLTYILTETLSRAFDTERLPAALGQVRASDRPDLAQFQCNGAMPAGKLAKKPPRQIAEAIARQLAGSPWLAKLEVAGPGFLNIDVTDQFLAEHINAVAEDERLGCPESESPRTVIIDYGGPNVAKPMHVGHLRSSVIGDCLRRLFAFQGDHTVGDVHMGDWGLPMGMLISELKRQQPDLPYFDLECGDPFPTESPVTIDDLERLYPLAAERCKKSVADLEEARKATGELQTGRAGYRALWRHFIDVSIAEMKRDFAALGVEFDLWLGEAAVNELIPSMIEDLEARGIAEQSEGALVVRVEDEGDKTQIPPLILLKSDGAVMYGTTDLATIVHRRCEIDPDLALYVVDHRQHLHFEQVFRSAQKAEINGKATLEHIGFGTVNGLDGKPFRTREGGVMKLQQLITMAIDAANRRIDEAGLAATYEEVERDKVALQVAVAAIRFADLSNYRLSDYVFDLDRFTRFEGKTGPYLLYAAVRMKSLLAKAAARGLEAGRILPPGDLERELILTLGQLPDALAAAYERRAPNELCEFAYLLAQAFSRFYQNCHIVSEADKTLQASRLGLARVTLNELLLVLSLIGIEAPERM